jgi:hypothetical protein
MYEKFKNYFITKIKSISIWKLLITILFFIFSLSIIIYNIATTEVINYFTIISLICFHLGLIIVYLIMNLVTYRRKSSEKEMYVFDAENVYFGIMLLLTILESLMRAIVFHKEMKTKVVDVIIILYYVNQFISVFGSMGQYFWIMNHLSIKIKYNNPTLKKIYEVTIMFMFWYNFVLGIDNIIYDARVIQLTDNQFAQLLTSITLAGIQK